LICQSARTSSTAGVAWVTEYGPGIVQNPPFRNDRISEDWVIFGDVASERYLLLGAVTARRSLTSFIVHRENSRITRITAFQPEIARNGEPEEPCPPHHSSPERA
jgi:hypothetical protein